MSISDENNTEEPGDRDEELCSGPCGCRRKSQGVGVNSNERKG